MKGLVSKIFTSSGNDVIVLFLTCGISIGDARTSASSGVSFCVSPGTVDITCTDNLCLFGASCDIVSWRKHYNLRYHVILYPEQLKISCDIMS